MQTVRWLIDREWRSPDVLPPPPLSLLLSPGFQRACLSVLPWMIFSLFQSSFCPCLLVVFFVDSLFLGDFESLWAFGPLSSSCTFPSPPLP